DNNKVVNCITKEVGGGTDHLIVLVDSSSYVRNLLKENIQHAMHEVTDRT
ncbi:hypothetical protein J1N35_033758, partial [Gossypium stocksii]